MRFLKSSKSVERFCQRTNILYVIYPNYIECKDRCKYCCNKKRNSWVHIYIDEVEQLSYIECRCFNIFDVVY